MQGSWKCKVFFTQKYCHSEISAVKSKGNIGNNGSFILKDGPYFDDSPVTDTVNINVTRYFSSLFSFKKGRQKQQVTGDQ